MFAVGEYILPVFVIRRLSKSVKIYFEYHTVLGFSRALIPKNRYSRLLMKNNILAQ
jgi:hypothetical protein